jgi:hypothetical protein
MFNLVTKDKPRYVIKGFICYKCLCVIDGKAPGKARKCKKCYSKNKV